MFENQIFCFFGTVGNPPSSDVHALHIYMAFSSSLVSFILDLNLFAR
jgi:hypothetical protein